MKRTALLIIATIGLASCAAWQQHGLQAIEAAQCVISDERLKIAFKEPELAKAWLKDLRGRLKSGEPDAVNDAAELAASLMECIP